MSDLRVRFAPSPTGYLHIGGVRTALFNWLYARHHRGKFILRIEDTDQSRSTEDAIQAILNGLRWVGLDWDEGPYRQTERMDLYRQHATKLFDQQQAYWCVCSAEDLEVRRKEAQAKGLPVKYDGRCRARGITNSSGEAALRFKAPQEGQTVIGDLIKGKVVFDNSVQDDLIILRTNGYPTYNFSVVVDDALMGITHVIRGDDHLNNTPRQIPIFQALGYEVPRFGHLPMILGGDKTRLSKRHGATSILAYQELGYLPEAMVNYLVRLGWSYGDQEIFSVAELIEKFSFDSVQKASALFDPDKLLWVNAQYIHHGEVKRLAALLQPFLDQAGLGDAARSAPEGWLERLVMALQERARTLQEMAAVATPYVRDNIPIEEAAAKKFLTPAIAPTLAKLADRLSALSEFSKDTLEKTFKELLDKEGIKMGQLAQPVRVALTGRTASPGIFDVMDLLGKDRTLARLRKGIERASAGQP
ncbi:glutamate--tRNA ligase [Nitrospiraceae bacterium AH_259_D15_M11_P09]|nr:glutamate--tRNA ligase [Nitrospiraceae bacterium AH_259_D15_M11_P09]